MATRHEAAEAKWADSPRASRGAKDDEKQQHRHLRSSCAGLPHCEVEEGDGVEMRDIRRALRSHGSADLTELHWTAKADLKDRGAATTHKTAQSPRVRRQQRHETSDDEASESDADLSGEDDDEEDEQQEMDEGWQSRLIEKGSSLLHAATDATAAMRSRIAEMAPSFTQKVQSGVSRGLSTARAGLASVDFQDDEDAEGEDRSDSDEERESLTSRLRSHTPSSGALKSRAKSALRGGKQVVEAARSALHSEPVQQAMDHARDTIQHARGAGERIVDKVRNRAVHFDWNDATDTLHHAQSRAGSAMRKAKDAAQRLRHNGEELFEEEKVHDMIAEGKSRISHMGERLRSTGERLHGKVRDALDDAEEDLGMTDESLHRGVRAGLRSADRVVSKNHDTRWPIAVIGMIFMLWLGAGLYQQFGTPIEPTPPATLLDAARLAVHDLKMGTLDGLHMLEARTQYYADLLTGRQPRPMTWTEKITSWFTGARPSNHFDARDAIHHARQRVAEAGEDVKQSLDERIEALQQRIRDARRSAAEHVKPAMKRTAEIPGDIADELQHHREHVHDYARMAKDSAHNLRDMAERKAEDLNLLPKRSLSARVWAWITGAETIPQQAERIAREASDKVYHGIDRVKDSLPSHHTPTLGERIRSYLPGYHAPTLSDTIEAELRDLNERARAAGYVLRDGVYKKLNDFTHPTLLDRIRAWLPGQQHSITLADRIKRDIPNLDTSGTAEEYFQRALAAGYDLVDGVYVKVHDFTHPSLLQRIKAHLPGQHSASNVVEESIEDLRRRVHALNDRIHHNVPDVDPRGTMHEYYERAEAAGSELRDSLHEKAHDLLHPHTSLSDRIKTQYRRATDNLSEHLARNIQGIDPRGTAEEYAARARAAGYDFRNGAYHLIDQHAPHRETRTDSSYDSTLMQQQQNILAGDPSTVPLDEIRSEIRGAQPQPDPLAHHSSVRAPVESVLERAKHAVQDGVYSIKTHLPGHHDSSSVARDSVSSPASTQPAPTYADAAGDRLRAAGQDMLDRVHHVKDGAREVLHEASDKLHSTGASLKDGAERGAHRARKEAEYVAHRAVHKGEALGHRAQEAINKANDHLQYHMP